MRAGPPRRHVPSDRSLAGLLVLVAAGLMGAGRTELARMLFGLTPVAAGEIRLAGTPVKRS